ncbi:hypothetical protein GCM10010280_63120 [Streptomyces pilosus]|uniref:Uncharacterized protein n=1 Tax=Streptomyces pilosus TaxID=28893 RepID=A0A918C5G2_9ACTN|nr:hypothetical protein GCM10010280_63120 [Streptomyces pilosus]
MESLRLEDVAFAWHEWHVCGTAPDTTKGQPGRNTLLSWPFSLCPRQEFPLGGAVVCGKVGEGVLNGFPSSVG